MCEKESEGRELGDRAKDFIIVEAWLLQETLRYQSDFILRQKTKGVVFPSKNPFAPYGSNTGGCVYYVKGAIFKQ
jgi:hypothetical protein